MIFKERTKSVSHRILESLNHRTTLSATEKVQFAHQVKGYEGELAFDHLLKDAEINGFVLNDLMLSTRDTCYQIDSLLITEETVYLFEVKNYSGTFYYKETSLFSSSGHALQDPVAQAERKRAYLHNLLLNQGVKIDIKVKIIFINPDCYIYDLPRVESLLFAGQLPAYFNTLTKQHPNQPDKNRNLARQLIAMHDESYRPANLPAYAFDQLKIGIYCAKCSSFTYNKSRQNIYCTVCGHKELAAQAIYRSIEELRLLFPDRPLTKAVAHTWCGNHWKKSRIRKVLETNYQVHNRGRGGYYTDN